MPSLAVCFCSVGGTAGAVITCPLEVVKTRLQSSCATFQTPTSVYVHQVVQQCPSQAPSTYKYSTCTSLPTHTLTTASQAGLGHSKKMSLYLCLRHVIQTEGIRGLFKGLGPNLVGVAPSRAIYFCAYAQSKVFFNSVFTPDTPLVHIGSAFIAGFTASTMTNPIWFIKTRLQLDQKRSGGLTTYHCIRSVYQQQGIVGFYKGITASYYGIAETIIHFVIYESIKAKLCEWRGEDLYSDERSPINFIEFMCAGAVSKTIATFFAYPHEVARTRLREEGNKYHKFWQTLGLVFREEGCRGLYRGLNAQLLRQIPNTAIMMATYEAVVYLCTTRRLPT
ncbi:hypothetical protein NP493_459g01034 [Ridgeia piscesae]|uniref:Mitochondrial carrier protein n=1 Tax=Ridgeia piscesae TaxID=27915 RepID=A0AAD9NRV7_RIDPI|nr:hypothetical protein NP493_459g01034 [Ridgeia piscesae]